MERGFLDAIIASIEKKEKNNSLACEIYRNAARASSSGHLHRRI